MHQLPPEQQILELAQIVVLVALCAKLWWTGLYKTYAFFFVYLVLEFLQALIPVVVPLDGNLYRDSYVVSETLIEPFYVLVVMELYSKALSHLAGIASVAQRYLRITLILAVIVALLPFLIEKIANTMTGYVFVFERVVMFSLVVFVLLISGFLVYYPVPLGRNVIVYLTGYAVFFMTVATVAFINNMGYFRNRLLGSVNMSVFLVCLTLWLVGLNRKGEGQRVVVGHQWNPRDEQRLLAQLEAINASLLRSGRK